MLLEMERQKIVDVGMILYKRGLVQLTGGNTSMRNAESGLIAIKPSSVPYIEMTPEDIVIVDENMKVIEAKEGRKPSTEAPMHTGIYRARKDIQAIVHCHPAYAVAWSLKEKEFLRTVIAAMYMTNGAVKVTKYEHPGSEALAKAAVEGIGNDFSTILQGHGIICGGYDIYHALEQAMVIEDAAKIACICEAMPGETKYFDKELAEAEGIECVSKLGL